MSAAVATRSQPQNPISTTTNPSSTSSRMGTSSPAERKKPSGKTEDARNSDSQATSGQAAGRTSPSRTDTSSTAKPLDSSTSTTDDTNTTNVETTKPLAPPPRPAAAQNNASTSNAPDGPDYFSGNHNNGSHLSLEPNPFEQSFSNPAAETPGKSLLPPVASLTSPASLLRDGAASAGYNWPNSLRSGPLSPAMLTGPTAATDYFDGHIRGGFPTPNESSLRTGLTPGGGGSMFPAPSPNSQALFNQLASAGVTPSTLDFHRTAMTAGAQQKSGAFDASAAAAGAPAADERGGQIKTEPGQATAQAGGAPRGSTDPFGQHDANDAANGLFLLAQARNAPGGGQGQAVLGPPQSNGAASNNPQLGSQMTAAGGTQSQHTSPNMGMRGAGRGSLGGSISGSARAPSEMSIDSEETKPNTRNKGKKGSTGKGSQVAGGRRKADDTPSKAPASKKSKSNAHSISAMPDFTQDSDEEMDMSKEMLNEHGKKMTDEEKRKNFLERNRVAALKCRQRKKQWLANLQAKVEIFSSENDALSAQVTQLREEIVNLKTLLLAHKDCPVSQAQGLGQMGMNSMAGDFNHHNNPYGMAMANNAQVMAQPRMQRR